MKKKKKYYQLETNDAERTASILIFGDITSWPWLDSDVAAYNLAQEINALDVDNIDVHINSYGGEVAEALAITNTLMRHKAKVKTYVDGFACSAATIIFMAGDERIVSPVSNFLVHPASARLNGTAEQFRREAENLDAITEQSITMYMRGLTKSREELVNLMAEERFLTPEEVLEWGFATKIDNFDNDDDDEDEAKENPTQCVRKLISQRLCTFPATSERENMEKLMDRLAGRIAEKMAGNWTVAFSEEQLGRLANCVAESMSAGISASAPTPPKTPDPKPETVLDKFLKLW